jgi:hypothetical protein
MYGFIGDLHLGVKLPRQDFVNSLKDFLTHIRNSKEECHAIFVCGDLFDHRLSIDDAKFAAQFVSALVYNHAGKNQQNIPVYFVAGTYSHDLDQYPIYLSMIDESVRANVFYIDRAGSLTVFGDKKVLFLPQEYDVDYTKLFEDTYDIIVGHGPIVSNTKNPCKTKKYETVHSAELLGKISKLCVFGHYHGYTDFENGVYYTGPWLRWKYGEDEPRVFFFCDDNLKVFTEPNLHAMEYVTIEVRDTEHLRECLSQTITSPHRFIINSLPSDMETYRGIINSTKSPLIRFQLEEIEDEDDLHLTVDEVVDAQAEAVQPIPKLIAYIKDKSGLDTEEQIRKYETQIKNITTRPGGKDGNVVYEEEDT